MIEHGVFPPFAALLTDHISLDDTTAVLTMKLSGVSDLLRYMRRRGDTTVCSDTCLLADLTRLQHHSNGAVATHAMQVLQKYGVLEAVRGGWE
jgi:hypothetical protein